MSAANTGSVSRNFFYVPTLEEAIAEEAEALQRIPKAQWGTAESTQRVEKIKELSSRLAWRSPESFKDLVERIVTFYDSYQRDVLGELPMTDEAFERLKTLCAHLCKKSQATQAASRPLFIPGRSSAFRLPSLASHKGGEERRLEVLENDESHESKQGSEFPF